MKAQTHGLLFLKVLLLPICVILSHAIFEYASLLITINFIHKLPILDQLRASQLSQKYTSINVLNVGLLSEIKEQFFIIFSAVPISSRVHNIYSLYYVSIMNS